MSYKIKAFARIKAAGLFFFLFSGSASAQNMIMFGGNSLARECYDHSQTATLTGSASRLDIEVCDRAIEDAALRRGDLVATYVNRGIIYTAIQDYAAAAKDYNYAIEMDNEVGEGYLNRGNLWFLARRFEQALLDYDKALEYGVNQTHVAHLNRGMAYEGLGRLQAAQKDYQQAVERAPEWPLATRKLEKVNSKLQ